MPVVISAVKPVDDIQDYAIGVARHLHGKAQYIIREVKEYYEEEDISCYHFPHDGFSVYPHGWLSQREQFLKHVAGGEPVIAQYQRRDNDNCRISA